MVSLTSDNYWIYYSSTCDDSQEAPQPAQLPRVGAGGDVATAVATAEMTNEGPETVEVSTVFLGQKTWENWENHDKSMKTMGKTMGKSWKIDFKKIGYGNWWEYMEE